MNEEEKKCTLSGKEPKNLENGAPDEIDEKTGMYKDYWILCESERSKGFVRPLRQTYKHVGTRPKNPTRELTIEELERYKQYGYIFFEKYPENESSITGRFWTKEQLESGCNGNTTMNISIAETYARNPEFYGATFCSHCKKHFPVGEEGEFVWEETNEKVGT